MTTLRYVILAGLGLVGSCSPYSGPRNGGGSASEFQQRYWSLDSSNNGQHLAASVGDQIEITLGSVGPGQYDEPEISSSAIRLANTALRWPPNPGGPVFIYILKARAEGEARFQINWTGGFKPERHETFTVTIQVVKPSKNPAAASEVMRPDQVNTEPSTKAWANLDNNVVQQAFVPSLLRISGVEVQLVTAMPGVQGGDVGMSVADADGQTLAVESKHVPVSECDHVLFVFPQGGLRVSPGKTYRIGISSTVFGWKYVDGGYASGDALLNDKPLLANTRSTFLFRTFGTDVSMFDPTEPVLGTWALNVAKSRFDPAPAPRSETRTFEAAPEGIKARIDFTAADGSGLSGLSSIYEQPGEIPSSNTEPDKITRVRSREYRIANLRAGKVVGRQTAVVSEDGMVMTIRKAHTFAFFETQQDVRVFDRQ
jgi:hypothetical protein